MNFKIPTKTLCEYYCKTTFLISKALRCIAPSSSFRPLMVGITTDLLPGNIFLTSGNLKTKIHNLSKDYLFYMAHVRKFFYYIKTYLVIKAYLKMEWEQD